MKGFIKKHKVTCIVVLALALGLGSLAARYEVLDVRKLKARVIEPLSSNWTLGITEPQLTSYSTPSKTMAWMGDTGGTGATGYHVNYFAGVTNSTLTSAQLQALSADDSNVYLVNAIVTGGNPASGTTGVAAGVTVFLPEFADVTDGQPITFRRIGSGTTDVFFVTIGGVSVVAVGKISSGVSFGNTSAVSGFLAANMNQIGDSITVVPDSGASTWYVSAFRENP